MLFASASHHGRPFATLMHERIPAQKVRLIAIYNMGSHTQMPLRAKVENKATLQLIRCAKWENAMSIHTQAEEEGATDMATYLPSDIGPAGKNGLPLFSCPIEQSELVIPRDCQPIYYFFTKFQENDKSRQASFGLLRFVSYSELFAEDESPNILLARMRGDKATALAP